MKLTVSRFHFSNFGMIGHIHGLNLKRIMQVRIFKMWPVAVSTRWPH